jgi:pimeloyl-ACP methyl ester carboxylesterase
LRRLFCFVFFMIMSCFSLASNISTFSFSPEPGPHAVGLRVVLQYDYSRTYRTRTDFAGNPATGERARPIQTLIWYPAHKSAAHRLTYGDYLGMLAREENFAPTSAEGAKATRQIEEEQDADADPTAPMQATRDAKPESGLFPLVIYAPSYNAPAFENADLCEYLASQGYVVMASPDMGAHTRDMTGNVEGIEAQARDISFLIGYAHSIPQADLSHVAVAGFSWGGISNLFAAARDDRITALIGLDGSARYFSNHIEASGYVHPREISLPVLFFTQSDSAPEIGKPGQFDIPHSVLNDMVHSDVYIVPMYEMRHLEFSSMHQRSPAYWKHYPAEKYSPEQTAESYRWMARYTLQFLNATFKQDSAAAAFLTNPPGKNGLPEHLLAVAFRQRSGITPTIPGLVSELKQRGFAHVAEVWAEAKAQNPDIRVKDADITACGKELMKENHLPEAVEVFKWYVSLSPESADGLTLLGEAYEKSSMKELAISTYKKSLEKDPGNFAAKMRLAELN